MTKHILLIAGFAMSLITTSCGKETIATQKAHKPKHELYLEWHNACLNGNTKQIDQHIQLFEGQIKTNPKDQLARVYLGSAHALRSKTSFWGPTKLKHLNQGKKLMDQAVNAAPHDPRVRTIRAIAYYKVPKRFDQRSTAVSDFEKLIPIVEKNTAGLATNERQAALYYAWLTFREEDHPQAEKARKLCHQLAPTTSYGKLTIQ